ncbi:MAG: ABC transporter ATP-binding protein [Nitrospinota bacterium]|nr:ABC transporter ATP-binding protein [Nitrospinota bacterium]
MSAIRAEGLTKRFGDVTAVDQLSLEVAEGEIFGLVGPDGAGKTTTMRLLTGIMDASSGDGWVFGRSVIRESEAIKDDIGYMSQRFGLYHDLTVLENIRFYADIYGVPRRQCEQKIDELLELSNLAPFKDRRAGNLSGGMKQKLGLSCALIHTPRVLFLDEPTNGVDPLYRREFWRILYQLQRQKVTVFVSTAYLDEAERCFRVGFLHEGKLIACDTPANIKKLLNGQVLELRFSNARQAAALLREDRPESSVGLFGDRVHMLTQDPERDLNQARSVVAKSHLELLSSRVIDPGLEDVFISVLKKDAGGTHAFE